MKKLAVELVTKCANYAQFMGKKTNSVPAFNRLSDSSIGEELVHRISGQRFFRGSQRAVKSGEITILPPPPVEITANGYHGITNEQFEALKKMRITKNEYGEIKDDFTGKTYFKSNVLPIGLNSDGSFGSISVGLWNRIQKLFS